MSAVFSHGIRYELTDKNPIKAVRQSAGRARVPLLLDVSEIYRLFDVLALRERSMVITDALTGIRRGELMGLKWEDLDFIGGRINVVRSVVDCTAGPCKTEASRKHVPMDEKHRTRAHGMATGVRLHQTRRLGLGFPTQTRLGAVLAPNHHATIHPASWSRLLA